MQRNLAWKVLLILAVFAVSLWSLYPIQEKISLGLDLQGGMHLVLRVDTSGMSEAQAQDAAERALEIVRNRVDQFGVREPQIHRQGRYEIVVQLPGVTDRRRALELIGRTALLEFKLVSDDPALIQKAHSGEEVEGVALLPLENERLLLQKEAALTGEALVTATVEFDETRFNEPYVSLELNAKGAREFSKITQENVGRRLAIVLDGKVMSAPVIRQHIPSGRAQITGNFSPDEARDLAIVLRAGALPAPMVKEEERYIGPLLGKDSVRSGVRASLLGGILVIGFMTLYYLLAGLIASFAVAFNFVLILAGLSLMGATLTLPGIAGMILTVGMAVDANVLIYERMREELKEGRPLRNAIANGYHKAFSAILDSNVTTLIAAALLFRFGSGPVKGFGVTLTLGLLASMFTAIFVTRVIFDLLLSSKRLNSIKMLQWIGQSRIDFIGKRRICYALSLIVVVGGMTWFFLLGEKAYGIDFTGGQVQEFKLETPVPIDQVRATLGRIGLKDAVIQELHDPQAGTHSIAIRTSEDVSEEIEKTLRENFPDRAFEPLRVENVGPSVGRLLRRQATLSLFLALGGILAYVWVRFKNVAFAAAGIAALFHDCLVAMAMMALTHREIDLTIVAAILTIAGFSVNDTIVIYDRIREKARTMRKATLVEIVNLSVNETLARTLLTSLTALMAVLALFVFGGTVLKNFAFCLLVGFISGVYSTVYIASPLVIAWSRKR